MYYSYVCIYMYTCTCIYMLLTNADVHLALDGGLVEGSEVPVVSGVGVAAVGQEDRHDLSVAERTGIV